jgi:uncharacterized protein (TIGR02611 family)
MSDQDGGVIAEDEALERRAGRLDRIRSKRHTYLVYKTMIAIVGFTIVLVGLALVPLPGPGWLIVFAGLAVLATEFAWAERLLDRGRRILRGWTEWVLARSLPVRLGIGTVSLALVAATFWAYLAWQGVPGWVPYVE